MVQQAFDLIAEKLGAALAVQEMKRQGTLLETDEGEMLLFKIGRASCRERV